MKGPERAADCGRACPCDWCTWQVVGDAGGGERGAAALGRGSWATLGADEFDCFRLFFKNDHSGCFLENGRGWRRKKSL